MISINVSRRRFLKASTLAGIATYIAPLGSSAYAALFEQKLLTPMRWDPKSGLARARVDGVAQVTGDKIFTRGVLD